VRALRELVRHRQQPVKASTAARAGIRALLAKHGIRLVATKLDSIIGTDLLDQLTCAVPTPGGSLRSSG
jgi:hypothetical protein